MFSGLGIMEILIIAGVALVVLGPDKFPQFAKISIRMFREIRGYWEDAKQDISKELRPLNKEVRELKHYKPEDYIDSLIGDDEDEEEDGEEDGEEDPHASSEHDYAEERDDYDEYETYGTPDDEVYGQGDAEAEPAEPETAPAGEDSDFGTDEAETAPTNDDEAGSTEMREVGDSDAEEPEPPATDDEEGSLPERLDG